MPDARDSPPPASWRSRSLRLDPADPELLEELLEEVAAASPRTGAFTMGHELEAFEAEFAAYCETNTPSASRRVPRRSCSHCAR